MTTDLKIERWAMEAAEELAKFEETAYLYPDYVKSHESVAQIIQHHHNAAGWEDLRDTVREIRDTAQPFGENEALGLIFTEIFEKAQAALAKLKEGK